MTPGRFVTLEGIEGAGKSTVAQYVSDWLSGQGIAVRPADTAALYFVATGLGDGAHHFSSTLQEHNSAVQTYLGRLRAAAHGSAAKSTPGAPAPNDGGGGAHQP